MDQQLIDRITADMSYEFQRTAPPEGFPRFHDIPTERHTSARFHELEQQHLWPTTWVIAGRASDVPNPGDYFTFDDLGVPLLIVRGTDGILRCFYNTCQHRGAPIVRDARGSSRRLRCQYHSWTYEIDGGALVSVPDERDFVDLDWEQRCLPQASCDTYAGFVFVNRDTAAQPLADWIGPLAELLDPFQGDTLREVYRESRIIPCNWKVTAEAFLEVYHFRHIHSHDGTSILDNRGAAMGLYPHGHSRMITPFSQQHMQRNGMSSWNDWQVRDTGPFPAIEGLPGLKNLPILGALFQSRDFKKAETELVIIVTPYMVKAVARDQLATPIDGLEDPTDLQTNFMGQMNKVYGKQEALPEGQYEGKYGFIVE